MKEKMKTCGIVAEYNPFHNGHIYQLNKARESSKCDCLIAIMSGNFVQRGEPAIIDKWTRAEAAIKNGIDVVIELPFICSTQAATKFASGAISLLKFAKCDAISFGSECGNLENLQEIADTPVNPDHLHYSLNKGMSFPKAYSLLTSEMLPNDILAVSYLKELKNTNIEIYPIQRTSNYNSFELHEMASALAIRNAIRNNNIENLPTPMADILINQTPTYFEDYWPYLRTFLLTSSRDYLQKMFLVNEGIENHLINNAKNNSTFKDFLESCTNWRYTSSRIKRTCLQIIMQNTKEEVMRLPKLDTLRILAFNDVGRHWLHNMRKEDVKIASKFSDVPYPWREMEYKSTLLYTSCMSEEKRKHLLDQEIKGAHYVK